MTYADQSRAMAVNAAAILLTRGDPLPLTLQARLLALGVDISVLERRYSR